MKLSVCIVSFNEEAKIGACLESVAWADEIVVVDSHSTDRTRAIAAAHGARVIERDWPGHVQQKNFAAEQAQGAWILGLDCDERVTPPLAAAIQAAIAAPDAADGYAVARLNRYLGRWWKRGGWYPSWRVRLWRRGKGRWVGENPHDRCEVEGRVGRLRGDLLHFTYDDLADHLRTINSFTSIAAREKDAKGRRPGVANLVLRPFWTFLKKYLLQGAWREGLAGWIFSVNAAYYVYLKYAKLWERRYVGDEGEAPGG